MKILVALIMGFCSGLMIYFLLGIMILPSNPALGTIFVAVTFLGGWALSTYLLLKSAKSVSKVFVRGFLLGAAEWLLLIPASVVMTGRAMSAATAHAANSTAATAGAALGGGLVTFLTGGLAITMAVVCLIGFAVAYLMGREMKPEQAVPTKKCPECAELVQAEARKCRFCGATLVAQVDELPAPTPQV
jgi:hypothetical protein